jgi:hypothetical protein
MTITIKLKENGKDGVAISSLEELLREIRAISSQTTKQKGLAAVLDKPSGQELIVIMAGPHWALDWFPDDYKGLSSFHTVSDLFDSDTDELPQNPEVVTYYIFGHHCEIPLEYTVSEEAALLGVREFVKSSDRPASLKWQKD